MRIEGQIVVVTGGGNGIGRSLCRAFAAEGARHVAVADLDGDAAAAVAAEVEAQGVLASSYAVDVADPVAVTALVDAVETDHGPIGLFFSNAGIAFAGGVVDTPLADWQRIWDVNVMAHVHAASAVVPRFVERGGGWLCSTASAAGLLNQIGSAPYGVTKAAAVSLAEWISITHGGDGVRVAVLCPQAVRTAMTAGQQDGGVAGVDGMMEPDDVAAKVIEALDAETFLILPHPEVAEYVTRKAEDRDRWIAGMQRLQARYGDAAI